MIKIDNELYNKSKLTAIIHNKLNNLINENILKDSDNMANQLNPANLINPNNLINKKQRENKQYKENKQHKENIKLKKDKINIEYKSYKPHNMLILKKDLKDSINFSDNSDNPNNSDNSDNSDNSITTLQNKLNDMKSDLLSSKYLKTIDEKIHNRLFNPDVSHKLAVSDELNNTLIEDDIIWAAGIEQEGTYILNPLDTDEDWKKTFKQFYVIDAGHIIDHIEKMRYDKKKYSAIVEAEQSGRTCDNVVVVDADPVNSMFEICTHVPFQPLQFLNTKTDLLYYVNTIKREQEKLIRDINNFYNNETLYKKKKKYYSIIPYPYCMNDKFCNADIVLNGKKDKPPMANYCGSYHITLTLPFKQMTITDSEYLNSYQRYMNQMQWIEPLILAMYSTIDMRGVGNTKNYSRGSYRIMQVGWGNIAGSDVRKLNQGLTRKANIELYWRNGLNFVGQQKVEKYCANKKKQYPDKFVDPARNVYDMGTDFRTPITRPIPDKYINQLSEKEKKELLGIPRDEQWRRVGKFLNLSVAETWGLRDLPPDKQYGVEFRILDYFDCKHLPSIVRLIAYIAENSRITSNVDYVYENKAWIKAVHEIMKLGWRADLPIEYIDELELNLGLKFSSKPTNVNSFYRVFLDALWEKNKNGLYVRELLPNAETGEYNEQDSSQLFSDIQKNEQPRLIHKNVNRESWEFKFLLILYNNSSIKKNILSFFLSLESEKIYKSNEIEKRIKKKIPNWETQWIDILYFLSYRKSITILVNKDGNVVGCRISDYNKENMKLLFENLLGEIIKIYPDLVKYSKKSLDENNIDENNIE